MATFEKMILARMLRQRSTFTEKLAWNMLRNRRMFGYRFKRQVVIRGFIPDFYCNELKLAIEIDGEIHDDQKEYDAMRQSILEGHDVTFLRISARDLEESPEKLAEGIRAHALKYSQLRPFPLHSVERG